MQVHGSDLIAIIPVSGFNLNSGENKLLLGINERCSDMNHAHLLWEISMG